MYQYYHISNGFFFYQEKTPLYFFKTEYVHFLAWCLGFRNHFHGSLSFPRLTHFFRFAEHPWPLLVYNLICQVTPNFSSFPSNTTMNIRMPFYCLINSSRTAWKPPFVFLGSTDFPGAWQDVYDDPLIMNTVILFP